MTSYEQDMEWLAERERHGCDCPLLWLRMHGCREGCGCKWCEIDAAVEDSIARLGYLE